MDEPAAAEQGRRCRGFPPLGEAPATPLVMRDYARYPVAASGTAAVYEISVHVPKGEPPAGGFPAIYVLDADADFVVVAETVRRVSRRSNATGIPPAVVVGIGHPETGAVHPDRRYRDFTLGAADAAMMSKVAAEACGGQAGYIAFLREDLLPAVAERHRIDQRRQTLLGHSLAGYFVLEVLAQCPDLFASYVAFSPSVWWDCLGLTRRLKAIRSGIPPGIRSYVAVGQWEEDLAPWQVGPSFGERYVAVRAARRMIANAQAIVSEIEASFEGRAAVRFEVGENDDHATVVTSLLCRALRFACPS